VNFKLQHAAMAKVAIITGGSRGLGKALARDLAEHGWQVIIDGRDADAVNRTAAELGPNVLAVPGDVTDPRHRSDLVAMAWTRGGLDLLVNNASALGPSPLPTLADHPLDGLEEIYRANVIAPIGLYQEAAFLLRSSGGAVINITSDAAVEPYETWGGYGSSKAALEQASNILAVEEPDLRVWWFDPGDMRTRMHQDAFPGEDISDRPDPETVVPALRALIERRPPSGRYRAADLLMEVMT
jgi:NAD(P)-dependent dehydrogenase (short-subunit alcohol dehydrogenase family)